MVVFVTKMTNPQRVGILSFVVRELSVCILYYCKPERFYIIKPFASFIYLFIFFFSKYVRVYHRNPERLTPRQQAGCWCPGKQFRNIDEMQVFTIYPVLFCSYHRFLTCARCLLENEEKWEGGGLI